MPVACARPAVVRPVALVALLAGLLALAVAAPAPAATYEYNVDEDMEPRNGTIVQGDTIEFYWDDDEHDLVVGGPEGTRVGEQQKEFRLRRTFNTPGSYTWLCTLHREMRAAFTVRADPNASGGANVPPPVDVVANTNGGSRFDPASVTVEPGQTVNFHWGGTGSVTFDDGPASGRGSIGGPYWGRTFTTPGTYRYRNTNGQTGVVNVVDPDAGTGSGIRPAPAGSTPNAQVQVGSGNSFTPSTVRIDEGGVVQWNWAGGVHNVRFTDGTDSGYKSSGSSALQFFKPGAYSYVCVAHSGMGGTVNVTDTGAPGQNETPTPGEDPGTDPGTDPGEDPGTDPGTDPGEDPGTDPGASIFDVAVGQGGDLFAPADITIDTGDTVRWTWAGGVHNVVFDDGARSPIQTSGTWSRTFRTASTYPYVCSLHPETMKGRVVVVGETVPGDDGTTDPGGTTTDPGDDTTDPGDATSSGEQTSGDTTRDASTSTAPRSTATAASSTGSSGSGAPARDTARPLLASVRAFLARRGRAHRLRLFVSEDAMLEVSMQAVGRSDDLLTRRRFRLYARQGKRSLRLPALSLGGSRYRLRVVAVDRAGNRSAPLVLTAGVRR